MDDSSKLDKKIILGMIAILLTFSSFVGVLALKNKNISDLTEYREDQIAFKEAYESLNDIIREKDGKKIKSLSIPSDNPVDIVSEEEAVNILKEKTGIIYFGFADCPWCRTMLPVLLNTLKNASIDNLYYLNIKDIRSTYKLNDKNKAVLETKGTDGYYQILEVLDEYLSDYTLTTSKNKVVKTGEKRLYAPTVVFVKDGKIEGIHVGTVDSQKDPYEDLSEEEITNLSNTYLELIKKVYDINCDSAC